MTIFHFLNKGNKLKLTEARRTDEVGHTNDPNYFFFHRMVHHPTSRCFVLKDKIQVLVEAGTLTLKSKQKKVTTNILTLNFGNFPKVVVKDRLTPILKGKMKATNSITEEQKAKGLIQLATKFGDIM